MSSASMAEWLRAWNIGHDEAMKAGGREFELCLSFQILNLFGMLSARGSVRLRATYAFPLRGGQPR